MSLAPVELCDLTQEGGIFNAILDATLSDVVILEDERRLEEIDLQPIGDKLMDMMQRGVPLKRYRNPMEIYQMLIYGLKCLANRKREVLAKKAEKAVEDARALLLQDVDMDAVKEFVRLNRSPKKAKKPTRATKKRDTDTVPPKGDNTLLEELLTENLPEDLNVIVEEFPISHQVNQDNSFGFENPPSLYEKENITAGMQSLDITSAGVNEFDVVPGEQLLVAEPEVAADVPIAGVQPRKPRRRRSRRRRRRRRSGLQSIYDLMNDMDRTFESEMRERQLDVPEVLPVLDEPSVLDGNGKVTGNVDLPTNDEYGLLDESARGLMPEEVVELGEVEVSEINNENLNSSREVFDLLLPKWKAGDFPLRLNDFLPTGKTSKLRKVTGIETLMRLYENKIVSIKFSEDRAITNILPGRMLLKDVKVPPKMMELYSSDSD